MSLSDPDNFNPGSAIKVPLAELAESKEKVARLRTGQRARPGAKL